MVLRPEIARIGSRLRKGKVLAPLTSVVLDGIHAQKNRKISIKPFGNGIMVVATIFGSGVDYARGRY